MHTGTDIRVDHGVQPSATREGDACPKKAALLGYYGMGNLGDELMLMCVTAWLARHGVDAVPIASNAEKVRGLHGTPAIQNYPLLGQFSWVEALVRGKAFQTLKAILRADIVVAGGGDVFRDALGWRAFSYQIEKLVFAVFCGKPVFLLNIGISRPVTFYGRKLLSWLLRRCRYIVVREQRSLELCRALGAADHVALLPDIVLNLPDFFPSAKGTTHPENTILVALHGKPNVYGQYLLTDARLWALAGVLDSMIEDHDVSICFFPFQLFEAGGDLQIHQQLQSRMRHSERTMLLDWTIDSAEIARRFSSCRLVLAMRLHAAVLSVAFEQRCVVLPYDEKVSAFAREVNIRFTLTASMLDVPSQTRAVLEQALSEPEVMRMTEARRAWLSFQLPEELVRG
jgi:polysaccharide pyruvyl transferase CsaB